MSLEESRCVWTNSRLSLEVVDSQTSMILTMSTFTMTAHTVCFLCPKEAFLLLSFMALIVLFCSILSVMSVVVMCRNQLYYFSALWPDTGVVAVDEADSKCEYQNVSSL